MLVQSSFSILRSSVTVRLKPYGVLPNDFYSFAFYSRSPVKYLNLCLVRILVTVRYNVYMLVWENPDVSL